MQRELAWEIQVHSYMDVKRRLNGDLVWELLTFFSLFFSLRERIRWIRIFIHFYVANWTFTVEMRFSTKLSKIFRHSAHGIRILSIERAFYKFYMIRFHGECSSSFHFTNKKPFFILFVLLNAHRKTIQPFSIHLILNWSHFQFRSAFSFHSSFLFSHFFHLCAAWNSYYKVVSNVQWTKSEHWTTDGKTNHAKLPFQLRIIL